MELHNKIFVDFNNIDIEGRARLNTKATFEDIERLNIKLETGLKVCLADDDGLAVEGIIELSENENIWTAKFDCNKLNNS